MRCCECQSPIVGDHYRHVSKPGIAVCSDHACLIEHLKFRAQGKELVEFITDRLVELNRDLLLDIACQYWTEQELCEWFYSGPYVLRHAREGEDDDCRGSIFDYDKPID